ncbi:MAG: metallophosphoesterase [Bacteroidota bacterium]
MSNKTILNKQKLIFIFSFLCVFTTFACAQKVRVPVVHNNMDKKGGKLQIKAGDRIFVERVTNTPLNLNNMRGNPSGTENGILLDFADTTFSGKVFYGLLPYHDSKHPMPIYRRQLGLEKGKVELILAKSFEGRYDMIDWVSKGFGTLGYRVISAEGETLYDGIVGFKKDNSGFDLDATIIEGPFVNLLTDKSATISFETLEKEKTYVEINGQKFEDNKSTTHHEITVSGLEANKEYEYKVFYGSMNQAYTLKTAPTPGSRTSFTFAYASDSRSGNGGGERDIYGANSYIMKKIMALAKMKNISFMQFSGDLINGYLSDRGMMDLQYANWKRAIEPFAHYFPVYVSMGNHEAFVRVFAENERSFGLMVDRFPYETESAEAVFSSHFVLPKNGPESEDGAIYDPEEDKVNFPSYEENVFYYIHDNVAVIVLNSDYWYAPTTQALSVMSGGMHGYLMDQQIAWLEKTMESLEANENVDHIFVTQHTPAFPNGGHTQDDMWYKGNNQMRPFVAGKPVAKGIIERRDEYLDILVNKSKKVIAILTGDEHNYARTELSDKTQIYLPNYLGDKITLSRTIYQINNGAAGAPYYAQEETPWTPMVSGFTTQHALVFFHINGSSVEMEVINPDTLEPVDKLKLR